MLNKWSFILFTSLFLIGISHHGLATTASLPIQDGKLNGTTQLLSGSTISFHEDNTFSSSLGIKGRVLCSVEQMQKAFEQTDEKTQAIEFFKCAEVTNINLKNKNLDSLTFKGSFHYPNITQPSELHLILKDSFIKEQLTMLKQKIPSKMDNSLQQYSLIKEIIISFTPNNKQTIQFNNLSGKTVTQMAFQDMNFVPALVAIFLSDNEANNFLESTNTFFKMLKDMKITHLELTAPQGKKNVLFNGSFQPMAFYATNGSELKLYNQDEKVILSIERLDEKTNVTLYYPKSAKELFSFTIDTENSVFDNFAKSLPSIQTEEQYKQLMSMMILAFLSETFKLHDVKWLNKDGKALLQADTLTLQPMTMPNAIKGIVKLTDNADGYDFFVLNGLNQIQYQNAKNEMRTITIQEMAERIKNTWGDKQTALKALFEEINSLPTDAYISTSFYKGILEGYQAAMGRYLLQKEFEELSNNFGSFAETNE